MKVIDEAAREHAWSAVLARDRAHDGLIFYAVRTTGIYCRPSCPSRKPKRSNVDFFVSSRDAEAAGFRACYRCEPEDEAGTTTERRLRRVVAFIDTHLDERITLERLGKMVGLSPPHLQRTFKRTYGVSPRRYQDARRLEQMKLELRGGAQVGPAVWAAGYGSSRGAYQSVANGLGMAPGTYRRGGNGLTIHYAVAATRFGRMIVGWTQKGVCAVLLDDARASLVESLQAEFPKALLKPDETPRAHWIEPLVAHLEGETPRVGVPLDLQGTSFQLRVWRALQEIPLGEVKSYAEIADAIGAPTSARAVARACASNRTAVLVPCHRVVRSDGSLGGYRWGEDRKRDLLEMESEVGDSAARSG